MLTITEELVLLLVDENKGAFVHTDSSTLNWIVAGGVLADLCIANRIELTNDQVINVDSTMTGEDLLDTTLLDIVETKRRRDIAYWLTSTVARADVILELALSRLVAKDVLKVDEEGVHLPSRWVRDTRRYPPGLATEDREVKTRILEQLLSSDEVVAHDVALIAVAQACHKFSALMTNQEYDEVEARLLTICKSTVLAKTLFHQIRVAMKLASKTPTARGLPLLGNTIEMAQDVRQFFSQQYLALGPVFRVKMLNRDYTVLAGAEANNFVSRYGREYLRSKETWTAFDQELGASQSMVSADGETHFKLRRSMRDGFSQKTIGTRLSTAIDIVRQQLNELPANKPLRVRRTMQRIVTEQLGVLTTGVSPAEILNELIFYLETMLTLRVTKARPGLELNKPRMHRARRRLIEFSNKILTAHDPHLRGSRTPDLIDACLATHRNDPDLMPETDFVMATLGPFFAGLETAASATSFFLYCLLKNPDLMERAHEEADRFFSGEIVANRAHDTFDVIRRAMMESMRLYPVAPAIIRTVSNSFDFQGYRISAGEQVLIALSVPNTLPQYFPDPEKFDIDRYLPGREEHRQPGAYVPFGVGTHRCLGSEFAELMIMTIVATILHDYEIELSPAKYELKIVQVPTAHPDDGFKIKLLESRAAQHRDEAKIA